ncbi:juvenile hormone acid O-methyltransferase-like [Musca autumnalis]|uniref:juvenile hormone acid O-methyltransferase-like n=1 Tax=Musca autumnalis TaxID=221902 RepID=UPI003CF622AA
MDNPKLYRETNQLQRQNAAIAVREFFSKFHWRSDGLDAIIDVGSAIGDVFLEIVCPLFRRDFQRIVCTDLNTNMVEYARKHYSDKVKNSEFRILNIATELPTELKGQFDHLLSFFCLQLVPNQRKAFQNIYSLLRPDGGNCLLTIFARSPYYDAYQTMSKTIKWSSYMSDVDDYTCSWHYSYDPVEEVKKLLKECGFREFEVQLKPTIYTYSNIEDFKNNMKAVSHYTHRIPIELQDDFMNDFAKAMIKAKPSFKYFNDHVGEFNFPYEQLVIFARR